MMSHSAEYREVTKADACEPTVPLRVARGLDGYTPRGDAIGFVEAWPVVEPVLGRLSPSKRCGKRRKSRKASYIDDNLRDLQEWCRWGFGLGSLERAPMRSIKKLKGQ